ncbi:MAG: hypothetical protein JWL76_684 [Thermoleophilia bacterium]|nr:hypothetical protein [Thermoleophilia bacterium]
MGIVTRTLQGSAAGVGFLCANPSRVSLGLIIGVVVLVVVIGFVVRATRGGGGGYDPLAPTGTAASTSSGASLAMPSALDVKPTKAEAKQAAAASGTRQPGSSITASGRTWRVLAVYTYEEDGERWEERRLRSGSEEAWLSSDDHGSLVLFDTPWPNASFPTQQTATMPDGSVANRIETGVATFDAVGEHDGWANGRVSYATYRSDGGTQWSFELDDDGEVDAWSGTTTTAVDA